MQIIIDRIENNQIVFELEDKTHINIPINLLPEAKENEIYEVTLNKKLTEEKSEKIDNLMNELFK